MGLRQQHGCNTHAAIPATATAFFVVGGIVIVIVLVAGVAHGLHFCCG
jgi:hypothetical protein